MDSVRHELDEAARQFALKKYESASDLRDEFGEDAPELAPVLHQYGRALLEHVISVSGALGGGSSLPQGDTVSNSLEDAKGAPDASMFSFSGDAPDEENEENKEGTKSNTQAPTLKRKAEDDDSDEEEPQAEEDDDDLGVAFTVLDLARVIYERILNGDVTQKSTGDEKGGKQATRPKLVLINEEVWDERAIERQLAEVRNDLGDVGLENALEILLSLLPPFARRLSDGYLRLGLALEFHPDAGEREKATGHVEQAAHILQRRLVELEKLKDGTEQGVTNASSDAMFTMDSDQLELEVRDVKELLGDLEIKVSEMKSSPTGALKEDGKPNNPVLEQAIKEAFLGVAAKDVSADLNEEPRPVNDLSARVKRKKGQARHD